MSDDSALDDPTQVLVVTKEVTEDVYPAGVSSSPSTYIRFIEGQVVTAAEVADAEARGLKVSTRKADNVASAYPGAVLGLGPSAATPLDYQAAGYRNEALDATKAAVATAEAADKAASVIVEANAVEVDVIPSTHESHVRAATNAENAKTQVAKAEANDPAKPYAERVEEARKLEPGRVPEDKFYGATDAALIAADEDPRASDFEKVAGPEDEAKVYERLASDGRDFEAEADERVPTQSSATQTVKAAPAKRSTARKSESNKETK